jgi:hypothetical protein
MSTRSAPLDLNHVQALNMITLDFRDKRHAKVRRWWEIYLRHVAFIAQFFPHKALPSLGYRFIPEPFQAAHQRIFLALLHRKFFELLDEAVNEPHSLGRFMRRLNYGFYCYREKKKTSFCTRLKE